MNRPTVCVVGLGYIGLPTAALLASHGYTVHGVDLNAETVETINQGNIHIVEPDLDAFVRSAVAAARLKADLRPKPADVYIICVPTPFHDLDQDTPQPNIDHVLAATRSIAALVKPGDLVILESTSPVGTCLKIEAVFEACGVDTASMDIAYCPERVIPGHIMTELVSNDRVVGGLTPRATTAAAAFYRSFVKGEVFETDAKTAEMCKLTENSFRDVNIAFANELSMVCEREGIQVWELIRLANRHPRVNVLQPGTGVGGHCIAVDPWFIVARNPDITPLIRSAREVNNHKTRWVIDRIKATAADKWAELGKKPKIACLGLAFKPDIDDLRESPALQVALSLQADGHDVLAVEPHIQKHDRLTLVTMEEALEQADLLVLLVKHRAFMPEAIRRGFSERAALDFCGLLC